MKTSTVLKKSLKVLEGNGDRPAWTKGVLARNKYRHEIRVTNPNAVKFCAVGAVSFVLGVGDEYSGSPDLDQAVRYLKAEVPIDTNNTYWWNHSVDRFNDNNNTKFEDVRDLFKRAIKAARGDGN